MWWPLTLTYIFKIIRPWLLKLCPLCNLFSSRSIISIFSTNNHYHQRVCRMIGLWQNSKISIFWNFSNFSAFTLKQNLQFSLHSFHIWHKSSLASEGVSHVMTFDLDLYFQGCSAFGGGCPRRWHLLIYLVFSEMFIYEQPVFKNWFAF